MSKNCRCDLMHDLILPTLLFAAVGGMVWAIRGCSGFGAVNGCVFAGVTWGAVWWFIARDPSGIQSRRYASGWIILALTLGIGLSGSRGWMQWPSFFEGRMQVNTPANVFVPISRTYGFIWLFIAGVPWAGIGACALAWCGAKRPARLVDWCIRIGCGIVGAIVAQIVFRCFPDVFLPLYATMKSQYLDAIAHPKATQFPNLTRLYGDNLLAMRHLGIYLGFLAYEAGRKDWKNVTLISTVGLLNGIGWAACQNWKWATDAFPGGQFNFWRCWESSGGISIGIAYGVAYFLVNRRISAEESAARRANARPTLERFGAYLGLLLGLGFSIKNGLKGWANIYLGNEHYWDHIFWMVIGALVLVGLAALIVRVRSRPLPRDYPGNVFPHAYGLLWLVLIVQNVIAQLVTGPHANWVETAFAIYYMLLFFMTAVVVYHYHFAKTRCPA